MTKLSHRVDESLRVEAELAEGNTHVVDFHVFNLELSSDGELWDNAIKGGIKWDGCANWSTSSEGAYHVCWHDQMAHLAEAFQVAYALAAKLMPNVIDKSCRWPPVPEEWKEGDAFRPYSKVKKKVGTDG
jgi:hypothetical protein